MYFGVDPSIREKTVKDKANHAVILDKATSDKLYKDVQSYRLITVATLVDRLKINGSLARKALRDLEEKGQIKKVVGHSKLSIYSKCCMIYCSFSSSGVAWIVEGGWPISKLNEAKVIKEILENLK